ncbi:PspA/IM30 family protein [Methylobacterium sp. SyP6R]|uniref:PspA/IM30 family protein n=1 Tax=Methylobacterium sp. SyP6R TaxID=2718876 RepID=UPI001F454768|nr:PspA/IM30 family protein [Methylobacterium sp. SyP6R]MCF4123972.1 PspA/IM30 family protein [Methylobacterium sp. SyP6R]
MLNLLSTLVRGAAARAAEDLHDQHAFLILEQQLRDAAAALDDSRRTLGRAIAQEAADARKQDALATRMAALEASAVAALAGGREDLAQEAAEALAEMEEEAQALATTRTAYGAEVAALRRAVRKGTRHFAELERGQRIARATDAVRRLRARRGQGMGSPAALAEAQATLRRLREAQAADAASDEALTIIEAAAPESLCERLEEAGFGPRARPSAGSVMERLRAKAQSQTSAA